MPIRASTQSRERGGRQLAAGTQSGQASLLRSRLATAAVRAVRPLMPSLR